jgi:hypothetical protein
MRELYYFNGLPLDADEQTNVFMNYNTFDFFSLTARYVGYSNTITFPNTANNRKAFEFITDSKSASTIPNRKGFMTVVVGGVEWISNRPCYVRTITNRISVNVLEDKSFFEDIKDKRVNETMTANLAWNNTNLLARRNTINELVQTPLYDAGRAWKPIVTLLDQNFQYGNEYWKNYIDAGTGTFAWTLNEVTLPEHGDISQILGIDQVFNPEYSYTFTLKVAVSNDFGVRILIYFFNEKDGIIEKQLISTKTYSAGDGVGNEETVVFASATPTKRYTKFGIMFGTFGSYNAGESFMYVTEASVVVSNPTTMFVNIPYYLPVIKYRSIIEHLFTHNGYTPQINWNEIDAIEGTTFTDRLSVSLAPDKMEYVVGDTINFAQHLPDETHEAWFRDFVIRFGLLVKQEGLNVKVRPIEAVIKDPSVRKDWTTKRDMNYQQEIAFNTTKYGQFNYFENDETYGSQWYEYFRIPDNDVLNKESRIFKSFLANSYTTEGTTKIPLIPLFTFFSEDFSEFEESRSVLLYLRDYVDTNDNARYATTDSTAHKVAKQYHHPIDNTSVGQTHWSKFLNLFYKTIFGIAVDTDLKAERSFKVIKRRYFLNHEDAQTISPFMTIYDNGELFLLMKATNVKPNTLVVCELFKV